MTKKGFIDIHKCISRAISVRLQTAPPNPGPFRERLGADRRRYLASLEQLGADWSSHGNARRSLEQFGAGWSELEARREQTH